MTVTHTDSGDDNARIRVVEAALTLFHTRGIKAVTMDDIAHALTISKRTLYQLFRDKEELLIEGARLLRRRERDDVARIEADSANVLETILKCFDRRMKELEAITPAFFEDMQRYSRVTDYFRRYNEEEAEEAVAFLKRGVEQGLFRTDVDFHLFYRLLNDLIGRTINSNICRSYSARDVFLNVVPVCLRGCATPAGQELIDAYVRKYLRSE